MAGRKSSWGARGLLRALLFACLLLAAAAMGPVAAAEAHGSSFTLKALGASGRLPYFVYRSHQGGTETGAVRVRNKGDRAGTVRLYGVDATTGETTGAVYRSRESARHDVGAWLSLPVHQLRLGPSQSRVVHFGVAVPAGAGPGQHLGGIVAENAALRRASRKRTSNGAFQVDVRALSIVAVQVDLPGKAVERLRLTGVRPGQAEGFQTLLIGMRNGGNQLLKGAASVVIRGEDGEVLKRKKFKLDTFVPHTAIAYPFAVPGVALGAGRYRAIVDVTYGDGHRAHLAGWFTISDEQLKQVFGSSSSAPPAASGGGGSSVLPWILAVVAAILLVGIVVWRLRRRRQAPSLPITYVTAVHFGAGGAGHEHIDRVRWLNPVTLATGESTWDGVVDWVRGGGRLRVRRDDGAELVVVVVEGERPYIRTRSDDGWTDDLLELPTY